MSSNTQHGKLLSELGLVQVVEGAAVEYHSVGLGLGLSVFVNVRGTNIITFGSNHGRMILGELRFGEGVIDDEVGSRQCEDCGLERSKYRVSS